MIRRLDERHPSYRERSTNEVIRLRSQLLAAFSEEGLPDTGLPFVLEELENGRHPALIAGAARGLRGRRQPYGPAVPFLLKAVRNLAHGDDTVSLDPLPLTHPDRTYTTALGEIFQTLEWYGPAARPWLAELRCPLSDGGFVLSSDYRSRLHDIIERLENTPAGEDPPAAGKEIPFSAPAASCCEGEGRVLSLPFFRRRGRKAAARALEQVRLEDQEGRTHTYHGFFEGQVVLTAFFYTRCENPNKCSLTVTRLAALQQQLKDRGLAERVRIAAITYDPVYDTPLRMRSYCESRRLQPDANTYALRVVAGFEAFQRWFGLGVNYIGSMINKHRVELYLTDAQGQVRHSFTRLQWEEAKVLAAVEAVLAVPAEAGTSGGAGRKGRILRSFRNLGHQLLSVLVFLGVAFFPKCPLCWAAYMSALGLTSLQAMAFRPWLVPLLLSGMVVNLYVIGRGCRRRKTFLPLVLSLAGMLLLAGALAFHTRGLSYAGLGLVLTASLLTTLPIVPKY